MDVSTHTPYTPLVFGGGVLPAVPSPGTCGNTEFEYVFVVIFMFFMIVDFLISVLTVVVVCFFASAIILWLKHHIWIESVIVEMHMIGEEKLTESMKKFIDSNKIHYWHLPAGNMHAYT